MNEELKDSFETIKDYKYDIENVLKYINNKKNILNELYNDYLKQIDYTISLDTFNFQTKLINVDYENNTLILKMFLNRMYCDYYKLYKKLSSYVKKDVTDIRIVVNNDYPKYKDLEIYTEYSFDIIDNLFSEILSVISQLSNYCLKQKHIVKEIEKKQQNGININNFFNEKKYYIIILEKNIEFYYQILQGYLAFQTKFIKRFYLKLKLIYAQICHDIHLETSAMKNTSSDTSFNRITDLSRFEHIIEDQIDKHLRDDTPNVIINLSSGSSKTTPNNDSNTNNNNSTINSNSTINTEDISAISDDSNENDKTNDLNDLNELNEISNSNLIDISNNQESSEIIECVNLNEEKEIEEQVNEEAKQETKEQELVIINIEIKEEKEKKEEKEEKEKKEEKEDLLEKINNMSIKFKNCINGFNYKMIKSIKICVKFI